MPNSQRHDPELQPLEDLWHTLLGIVIEIVVLPFAAIAWLWRYHKK